uniref:Pyrin domain-containing protein n=1 Tax=Vombatus ursinus TaxID=29139 RepID=A0A4X2LKA8_VOMUR
RAKSPKPLLHLTNSLDELVVHELRKFKRKLYHIALKKCHKPIPWGKLEPAHCDDLAQMLVEYYGEKYALEVTLKVLKAIHQQDVANMLIKKIQQGELGLGLMLSCCLSP